MASKRGIVCKALLEKKEVAKGGGSQAQAAVPLLVVYFALPLFMAAGGKL